MEAARVNSVRLSPESGAGHRAGRDPVRQRHGQPADVVAGARRSSARSRRPSPSRRLRRRRAWRVTRPAQSGRPSRSRRMGHAVQGADRLPTEAANRPLRTNRRRRKTKSRKRSRRREFPGRACRPASSPPVNAEANGKAPSAPLNLTEPAPPTPSPGAEKAPPEPDEPPTVEHRAAIRPPNANRQSPAANEP